MYNQYFWFPFGDWQAICYYNHMILVILRMINKVAIRILAGEGVDIWKGGHSSGPERFCQGLPCCGEKMFHNPSFHYKLTEEE